VEELEKQAIFVRLGIGEDDTEIFFCGFVDLIVDAKARIGCGRN
jgi:hypothetical protein